MKRFALFAAGLGVLVAGIVLQPGAAQGQAGREQRPQAEPRRDCGQRLSEVAGVLQSASWDFRSPSSSRARTARERTTFFQMSRDTFLEMQQATADVRARPHPCVISSSTI